MPHLPVFIEIVVCNGHAGLKINLYFSTIYYAFTFKILHLFLKKHKFN